MQEFSRAMGQAPPPGIAQYRARYMPPMHNMPEHNAPPPGYFEAPPRYPNAPPRMAYARPIPEYSQNFNPGYQNPGMYPSMRPQSPVLYHLDPGAMPYIPARYVPPPPGSLRPEQSRPRPGPPPGVGPNMASLQRPMSGPSPGPNPNLGLPTDFVPPPMGMQKGAMPQFYLGGNKKPASSDGISEEERKAFGIDKFLMNLRTRKGPLIAIEQGVDLTTLGLKLNSPEYFSS